MAIVLQTPPSLEPISLSEMKSYIRVDHADEDALIQALIVRARAWVEETTSRALIEQTWDYWLDDWPRARGQRDEWWDGTREGPFSLLHPTTSFLVIPKGPVISVTEVATYDRDGAESIWDPQHYRADLYASTPRIVLTSGAGWPADGLRSTSGIRVRFKAGYGATADSVPAPIKQAISMLVAHWFDNREAAIVGSITNDARHSVDSLLAPYKAVTL